MVVQSSVISAIPQKPGVYLMKNGNGKVIYVGKARSLRERVRSYFSVKYSQKNRVLSSKIHSVDYIVTDSEVDALVLEANLIKLHLPHYNIRLKDDKKYPYIKISIHEEFPAVFPTRDLGDRNSIYFGPYTSVKTMKRALKSATEIFPVRLCRGKMASRVCLAYHIGRCPGPCEYKISKEEYRDTVQELVEFLSGKSKRIEQRLTTRMHTLSEKLEFEEAAMVRDKLFSIQSIMQRQRVVFDKPMDMDVFGLQKKRTHACIAVVMVREGRISGVEHYILHIQVRATDAEIMRAFTLQYYKNAFYIPKKIVVQEMDEKEVIEKWLNRTVIISKRGKEVELIRFATQNAGVWLESEQVERIPRALEELKKYLALPRIPRKMEAFDISNIGGKYAVGSCVSFVNGMVHKAGYRRFRIKTVDEINDVAMMKEIVTRRIKANKKVPDLVLVDGSIAQVRGVQECIPGGVAIFGLAKRLEELHTTDGKIISLPKSSLALRLLQRIRDEAHRFAISYHKKLRDHPQSILGEIPGIGKTRRKILLQHFKSFEKLKQASLQELEKVPGIGKTYASKIHTFLRGGHSKE